MKRRYGVPRDVFATVKIIGFRVLELIFVLGSAFLAFLFGSKLFPTTQVIQLILFVILSFLLALFLVAPANGGKRNWHSLLISIKRRKKRWVSFDWNRGA